MAKKLQTLVASFLITGSLFSPLYSAEAKKGQRAKNINDGLGNAIVESMGKSMKEGLENGLGELKNFPTEQEMQSAYRLGKIYGFFDALTGKAKPPKKLVSQDEAYKSIKKYAEKESKDKYNKNDKIIMSDMDSIKRILENPDEFLRKMEESDRKFYDSLDTSRGDYDPKKARNKYSYIFSYNINWNNLSKEEKLFIYLIEKKLDLVRKVNNGQLSYYPEEAKNEKFRGYDADRFFKRYGKLKDAFMYLDK